MRKSISLFRNICLVTSIPQVSLQYLLFALAKFLHPTNLHLFLAGFNTDFHPIEKKIKIKSILFLEMEIHHRCVLRCACCAASCSNFFILFSSDSRSLHTLHLYLLITCVLSGSNPIHFKWYHS